MTKQVVSTQQIIVNATISSQRESGLIKLDCSPSGAGAAGIKVAFSIVSIRSVKDFDLNIESTSKGGRIDFQNARSVFQNAKS